MCGEDHRQGPGTVAWKGLRCADVKQETAGMLLDHLASGTGKHDSEIQPRVHAESLSKQGFSFLIQD